MSVLELGSFVHLRSPSLGSIFIPVSSWEGWIFFFLVLATGGATIGLEQSETSNVLTTLQLTGQAPPCNISLLFLSTKD